MADALAQGDLARLMNDIPAYITAVGALGVAAFGAVEAIGKTIFVFDMPWFGRRKRAMGLPYVGFDKVRRLLHVVAPAMRASYGEEFDRIVRQQYRAGRSKGAAPETIRQGVRLGLPFIGLKDASKVIGDIWGLPGERAQLLARALIDEKSDGSATTPAEDAAEAQALAARFATALDTRVQAAFDLAEEIYESRARFWAGAVAVGMSLVYHWAVSTPSQRFDVGGWLVALLVGMAAVPLAPIAKDLASSLSDALAALGRLRGKAA
jgi:hypothetical protein